MRPAPGDLGREEQEEHASLKFSWLVSSQRVWGSLFLLFPACVVSPGADQGGPAAAPALLVRRAGWGRRSGFSLRPGGRSAGSGLRGFVGVGLGGFRGCLRGFAGWRTRAACAVVGVGWAELAGCALAVRSGWGRLAGTGGTRFVKVLRAWLLPEGLGKLVPLVPLA